MPRPSTHWRCGRNVAPRSASTRSGVALSAMTPPPSRRRQVIDVRMRAQLRLELLAPAQPDELGHLAPRIVEVPEGAGARREVRDARRLEPGLHPVDAEV